MGNKISAVVALLVFLSSCSHKEQEIAQMRKLLPVGVQYQEKSEWCWAACGAMTVGYIQHKELKQCDLVKGYFKIDHAAHCDTVKNSPINDVYIPGFVCDTVTIAASPDDLKHNLDSDLPFIIALQKVNPMGVFRQGFSHMIVVRGYDFTDGLHNVEIIDPDSGKGANYYDYAALQYEPMKWSWTNTWYNLRKEKQ